ncbi:hypothetical protein GCM10010177_45390 [Actinomadura citrea]|nr:hypothetical protein GCM10010177_45390 [Actinomadura citrea]
MAGAEYTTPDRISPLTIDARSAWAIWTRTLFLGPSEGRFSIWVATPGPRCRVGSEHAAGEI